MYQDIDYFREEHAADIQKINAIICSQVISDVALINQIGAHIISSGGKRLRPITTILAGKALNFNEIILYQQAAMIEFIHTSTLLHDDVVDQSDLRRGQSTANLLFGNAAAVLVGDFLYTRAFQLMVSAQSLPLMRIMSDATNIIASGEVMQLMNIGNTELTQNEYMQVIENKTAKLFEAAAEIAAILAHASPEHQHALKEYGRYLGLIFQIVDDLLDYVGDSDTIGKNVGDDLAEGKATLPLIYLLQHGSQEAKKTIKYALKHADHKHFMQISAYIHQSNALDYCRNVVNELAQKAQKALMPLPKNRYTDTLCELAVASINRVN